MTTTNFGLIIRCPLFLSVQHMLNQALAKVASVQCANAVNPRIRSLILTKKTYAQDKYLKQSSSKFMKKNLFKTWLP